MLHKSDVDFSLIQLIIHSAISFLEAQLITPGTYLARFLATAGDKCKEYLQCTVADSCDQIT